jgi:hypothetical protein
MGIELDHADLATPVVLRHRHEVRVRHRVVAAEHDRHDVCLEDVEDRPLHGCMTLLETGGNALGIPVVDDSELGEGIDAEEHVWARSRALGEIVDQPDGTRAETGTRTIRYPFVERRPDDRHIGAAQRFRCQSELDLAERPEPA